MLPVDDTGATGARTRDGISSICRFQRLTPILRPASTLHHPNCKPENDNGPTATSTQRRQSPRFPAHGPRLESPCPVPLWLLVAGSNSDNAAIELNGTGASLCSTGVAILRRRQSLATHLCPSPLPQQTGPRAPESRVRTSTNPRFPRGTLEICSAVSPLPPLGTIAGSSPEPPSPISFAVLYSLVLRMLLFLAAPTAPTPTSGWFPSLPARWDMCRCMRISGAGGILRRETEAAWLTKRQRFIPRPFSPMLARFDANRRC